MSPLSFRSVTRTRHELLIIVAAEKAQHVKALAPENIFNKDFLNLVNLVREGRNWSVSCRRCRTGQISKFSCVQQSVENCWKSWLKFWVLKQLTLFVLATDDFYECLRCLQHLYETRPRNQREDLLLHLPRRVDSNQYQQRNPVRFLWQLPTEGGSLFFVCKFEGARCIQWGSNRVRVGLLLLLNECLMNHKFLLRSVFLNLNINEAR